MKQLVSSNDAANILGLSLQGIHYRIKKGQLESVKQDGKIYVYIDSSEIKNFQQKATNQNNQATQNQPSKEEYSYLNELALKSKDEQIHILKKTIKFMRRQYTSEIERLDNNQKKILEVFQSEVDLLKSAFNEMKAIYQIEHQEKKEQSKAHSHQIGLPFMDLKDFFVLMRNYHKTDDQIKAILLQKIKNGDKRFIYKKDTKEVIIFKNDFLDLI